MTVKTKTLIYQIASVSGEKHQRVIKDEHKRRKKDEHRWNTMDDIAAAAHSTGIDFKVNSIERRTTK